MSDVKLDNATLERLKKAHKEIDRYILTDPADEKKVFLEVLLRPMESEHLEYLIDMMGKGRMVKPIREIIFKLLIWPKPAIVEAAFATRPGLITVLGGEMQADLGLDAKSQKKRL